MEPDLTMVLRNGILHGSRQMAATLILLGSSAVALGANSVDCDRSARDLSSSDELVVTVVDLTDGETNIGIERSLDAASADDESIAPHLYLTPRIASILDDVFEEESATSDESTDAAMTPIADRSDEASKTAQPDTDDPTVDVQPAIIRLHREMYRTDI